MLRKLNYKYLAVLIILFLVISLMERVFANDFSNLSNYELSQSFMQVQPNLSNDQLDKFILGKSFFSIPWVEAPSSTTARDGLGPLFSANSCVICHVKNGRGKVFKVNNIVDRSHVIRLSIPSNGTDEHQEMIAKLGSIPEPNYGVQISINGVPGVPFEAKSLVHYSTKNIYYSDSTIIILQQPIVELEKLGYGDLLPNTIISARIAPALVGLGLLEQITDEQILANEDINDSNHDGISGKANRVWSEQTNKIEIGRYSWKASVPTVKYQSATAAVNDIGLTNPIYEHQSCTSIQVECINSSKDGEKHELTAQRLNAISYYLTHLKLPKSIISQYQGQILFSEIGCSQCHVPSYSLPNVTIYPYSDFLLHDMGKDLADGRSEFDALGNEWRTPPLWRLGRVSLILKDNKNFLHDGRASNLEQAIIWHGGEAEKSKTLFMNLSVSSRGKILQFLNEI
ncbi:MAG: hypothetical protein H0A74_00440 [Candidatus Vesicomyosocius endoextente]|uniref:Thiol oxidoreductase n=1 Tax=Candidatus Vesicomyosocius endoextente TaxID=2738853 RepID=A0A853G702_9GAMM|nr:hypothetical protein [Candidatus Vesicomyosocius endoextente]